MPAKRSERLSSIDTAWLRMEDPTNLMMVTGVLVFDQPLNFARLRQTVEQRLLMLRPLPSESRGCRWHAALAR